MTAARTTFRRRTEGLLILIALAALASAPLSGWLMFWYAPERTQCASVNVCPSGCVLYERQVAEALVANGCDVFLQPTIVVCRNAHRTMPLMAHSNGIRALILSQQRVGDEFTVVTQLPNLEYISLTKCEPTLSSWSFLGEVKNLKVLRITDVGLDDADLSDMKLATPLTELDLSHNRDVTAVGVRAITRDTLLLKLSLTSTGVADLTFLEGMNALEFLDLMGTNIRDEDLCVLSTLPNLRTLNIRHTAVTDGGVEAILRMKRLTHLEIGNTEISQGAIDRLRATISSVVL